MSFYLNMLRGYDFADSIARYEKRNPSAKTLGSSECQRSGCCCWTRPGRLTQDDLSRIASSKGMTNEEFFKSFCVVDDPGRGGLVPVLRRKHQEHYAGEYLPGDETYSAESPCVFFETDANGKGACAVHDIKPSECSKYRCWEPSESMKIAWTREELIAIGWDGVDEDYS